MQVSGQLHVSASLPPPNWTRWWRDKMSRPQ